MHREVNVGEVNVFFQGVVNVKEVNDIAPFFTHHSLQLSGCISSSVNHRNNFILGSFGFFFLGFFVSFSPGGHPLRHAEDDLAGLHQRRLHLVDGRTDLNFWDAAKKIYNVLRGHSYIFHS